MKPLVLKLILAALCCFVIQCSPSQSQNAAHDANSNRTQAFTESVAIDSEWKIEVTHFDLQPKTQWSTSCTNNGDCWYWSSKELFAPAAEKLRDIPVRRQDTEFLISASPVSKDNGWIVTTAGLFRVLNFTTNWTPVAVPGFGPQQGRIHGVYFSDEKNGWIAGGVFRSPLPGEPVPNNAVSDDRTQILIGAIARTNDGGRTWETKRFDQLIGRFNGIVFAKRTGLISGDAGLIATTDGGDNWKEVLTDLNRRATGDRLEVQAISVLDDSRVWLSLSGSQLLTSDDGLKTWKLVPKPGALGDEAPPFSELAFVDERRGLAVLRELGRGRIYKTNDGGKTWAQIKIDKNVSGLTVIPGNRQITAVADGEVYLFTPT